LFPGFDHLFQLHDPVSSRPFRGLFAPNDVDLAIGISRGELTSALSRATVGWAMGSPEPSDVIWTTFAHPLIVDERVTQLLRANDVSGWDTYRVEVRNKAGVVVPGYAGLAITGRCGRFDFERSEIVLKEFPGGWFPRFKGIFVPPDSWDGSDMFMEREGPLARSSMYRFATDRVRTLLNRARVKNLRLAALADEEVDVGSVRIASPDRLPKNLGERLHRAYFEANVPRPAGV
jgi:hypothetical protein